MIFLCTESHSALSASADDGLPHDIPSMVPSTSSTYLLPMVGMHYRSTVQLQCCKKNIPLGRLIIQKSNGRTLINSVTISSVTAALAAW
jgi:hypothetical protein